MNKEMIIVRKKEKFSAVGYILLSFLVPFCVMVIGLIGLHVTPFGDNTLVIVDGRTYLAQLAYVGRLLKGQENLFYSYELGPGGNMLTGLFCGLLNPTLLLAVFSTLENLPTLFTWITVINMALAGVTSYLLLVHFYGHRLRNIILSTSYSMSGFMVANTFQWIFFPAVQVLPLVVLGIIWIEEDRSPLLYIFSLAYGIIYYFYFGYILCVASGVIFFARMIANVENNAGKRGKQFIRYAISSLIAGFLGAAIWLPCIKSLSGGARLSQTALSEFTFNENMPFIQIFSKLFTGANSTNELVSGQPNIFCGILVLALVILYFFNKSIGKRKKIMAGVVMAFYLISFYIVSFSMAMQGFTHTNWFNYRYSFVFCFIMIMIAGEELAHWESITLRDTGKSWIILIISVVLIFSQSYEYISGGCVLLDLVLLFIIWYAFRMHKLTPEKAPKRVLAMLVLLVVCGNMYGNYVISTNKIISNQTGYEEYETASLKYGTNIEALNTVDQGLYRVENEQPLFKSVGLDSLLYGYNNLAAYSPTIRSFVHQNLCKLGLNWFDTRHWYPEGEMAATDALLGVKYILSENDLTEQKNYEKRFEIDNTKLYQNHNALGISILSAAATENVTLTSDAFENLNNVWKSMTGEEQDIYTEENDITFTLHTAASEMTTTKQEAVEKTEQLLNVSEASSDTSSASDGEDEEPTGTYIEYSFIAAKDGAVYSYNSAVVESQSGLLNSVMRYEGTYQKGDIVTGYFEIDSDSVTSDSFNYYCATRQFAYENLSVLEEYAAKLQAEDISLTKEKSTLLTGTYTSDGEQCILFTIPWDEGWSCYIDGQKVDINKTWDLFMSVDAPEGTHTYELRYFPAWMNYGIVISAASVAALIVFLIALHVKKTAEKRKCQIQAFEKQ